MPPAYGTPGNSTYVDPFAAKALPYNGGAAPAATPAPAPAVAPSKTSSEPAVLSSSSITDHIATNTDKLASMAQKGTTINPNTGTTTYADGSAVSAPPDSTYNDKTGQYEYNGKTYGVSEFYGQNGQAPDNDYTAITKMFEPLKAQLDANTLSQVNVIQSQFDALKSKQEEFNRRAEQSRSQALLLGGASRYSPLTAAGTTMAQTSYGLQQIQDLNSREDAAIAQAQQAGQDGDMKLMGQMLDMAEKVRTDKQSAAQKVIDQLQAANEKMSEAHLTASRDSAVADLVSHGVTDLAQLLEQLNAGGGGFTADEVAKTLGNLTVSGNPKNLSSDVATFNYLRDNIGLPEEITKLPPEEQYFAYLAALKKANGAPAAGFTLGTNQVRYDADGNPIAHGPKGTTAAGSGTGTGSGSGSGSGNNAPSWEDYLAAAQKASGVSYFMGPEEQQLREQYDATYGDGTGEKFTSTELKKLEQAGLSKATRQKQLDYLYGTKTPAGSADLPSSLQ